MHNINDQTINLNIAEIEFQLVSLVSSLYTIVLLLNLIWIVLALYFMILCFICERDIRLKCKIWKRMGYRWKSLCENPLNCIYIFFHCYFAQLCWWDGNKEKEYIHTLKSPNTVLNPDRRFSSKLTTITNNFLHEESYFANVNEI